MGPMLRQMRARKTFWKVMSLSKGRAPPLQTSVVEHLRASTNGDGGWRAVRNLECMGRYVIPDMYASLRATVLGVLTQL